MHAIAKMILITPHIYTDRQTDRQGELWEPQGTSLDRLIPTFYDSLNLREGQGVVFGGDLPYYTDRQTDGRTNRRTDRQTDRVTPGYLLVPH